MPQNISSLNSFMLMAIVAEIFSFIWNSKLIMAEDIKLFNTSWEAATAL